VVRSEPTAHSACGAPRYLRSAGTADVGEGEARSTGAIGYPDLAAVAADGRIVRAAANGDSCRDATSRDVEHDELTRPLVGHVSVASVRRDLHIVRVAETTGDGQRSQR
jgi:hypothetical protein